MYRRQRFFSLPELLWFLCVPLSLVLLLAFALQQPRMQANNIFSRNIWLLVVVVFWFARCNHCDGQHIFRHTPLTCALRAISKITFYQIDVLCLAESWTNGDCIYAMLFSCFRVRNVYAACSDYPTITCMKMLEHLDEIDWPVRIDIPCRTPKFQFKYDNNKKQSHGIYFSVFSKYKCRENIRLAIFHFSFYWK